MIYVAKLFFPELHENWYQAKQGTRLNCQKMFNNILSTCITREIELDLILFCIFTILLCVTISSALNLN